MNQMNYLALISQATIVVQAVLGLLIFMSVVSWSIIFFKWISLSLSRRRVERDLKSFQDARDLRTAVQTVGMSRNSPAYHVAVWGIQEYKRLEEREYDPKDRQRLMADNLNRALEHGVSDQVRRLGHGLPFLATCSNAGPFIGLFGTVWGIMHAFHNIGAMKTASLAVVAPGISEALIATAVGLAVAIPATVAYNYLLGKLNNVQAELTTFAGAFINRVQRELPSRPTDKNFRRLKDFEEPHGTELD